MRQKYFYREKNASLIRSLASDLGADAQRHTLLVLQAPLQPGTTAARLCGACAAEPALGGASALAVRAC
jgi:hypothetical protein